MWAAKRAETPGLQEIVLREEVRLQEADPTAQIQATHPVLTAHQEAVNHQVQVIPQVATVRPEAIQGHPETGFSPNSTYIYIVCVASVQNALA